MEELSLYKLNEHIMMMVVKSSKRKRKKVRTKYFLCIFEIGKRSRRSIG